MATQSLTTANNQNVQLSASERFTTAVMKEIASSSGELKVSELQKKLSNNYFIKIDQVLKDLEKKRMAKPESTRDLLAYTWENVNFAKLATDVVAYSSIGLDPTQKNHLFPIPYKNTSNNKYDIVFMEGYKGLEIKAMKYGFDAPDDVVIEVVYEKDKFKSLKKDHKRSVESYEFEIVDDFDRGDIKGGFYYLVYKDNPTKNKLRVFNMDAIEKRIPKHASVEFWGGEKDVWKDGKKTGNKEKVEGWKDEMVYKTIARAAYDSITIDAEKIDQHVLQMIQNDEERSSYAQIEPVQSNPIPSMDKAKEFNYDEAVIDEEPSTTMELKPAPETKVSDFNVEKPKTEPKAEEKQSVTPSLNFG